MRRLLSFLCLFVIGWGCAWGQTYPKTWDFTNWSTVLTGEGWGNDGTVKTASYVLNNGVLCTNTAGSGGVGNFTNATVVPETEGR